MKSFQWIEVFQPYDLVIVYLTVGLAAAATISYISSSKLKYHKQKRRDE